MLQLGRSQRNNRNQQKPAYYKLINVRGNVIVWLNKTNYVDI